MARKRPEKAKVPATVEAPTKPVRLDLDPETHRLLRLVAAADDKSMAAFARDLVAVSVREEAKRRGFR